MLKFKKIVIWLFILGLTIVPCFSANNDYQSCSSLFVWQLQDSVNYEQILFSWNSKDVHDLTSRFCANVASLKCIDSSDWENTADYFDASQSLFLTILCNSVNVQTPYLSWNEILKKKSFLDFWMVRSVTWVYESCHRLSSMNNCDYAYYLPQIFNKIENDMFNIRQARFFGVNELSNPFSAEDAANQFSISMMPWLNIQPWLSAGICDSNSTYYKSTCKTLKNYVKDANNLLHNTKIIDVEKLQELKDSADCENYPDFNILYCWLLWTNSEYRFLNAVYNEYFWYKVFLTYYSSYINWNGFLDADYKTQEERYEKNQERISLINDQLSKSKTAITLSLRSLTEMTYSFPVHIGFLMYHEDAKLFMENSSKLYAPIRTLYDKLRNVQIKES